jgi:hypothetical protein
LLELHDILAVQRELVVHLGGQLGVHGVRVAVLSLRVLERLFRSLRLQLDYALHGDAPTVHRTIDPERLPGQMGLLVDVADEHLHRDRQPVRNAGFVDGVLVAARVRVEIGTSDRSGDVRARRTSGTPFADDAPAPSAVKSASGRNEKRRAEMTLEAVLESYRPEDRLHESSGLRFVDGFESCPCVP